MKLRPFNDEVLYACDPVRVLSQHDVERLAAEALASSTGKRRICLHPHPDHSLHEMLIALRRDAYYPPHMHTDGEETQQVLYGLARVLIYNASGDESHSIPLGPFGSGRSSYVRIPENTCHSLVIESDVLVYLETKNGPFRPETNVTAPFVCNKSKEEPL